MNILFITVSLSNLEANQGLYANLVNEFKNQGHNICAVAPSLNKGKTSLVIENGVEVLRVKLGQFRGVSSMKKGLVYQYMIIKYLFYIMKKFKKKDFDLIIAHSLPPEIGVLVFCLKKIFGCKFYLMQNDYTWQDAVSFGFFRKNGLICSYYRFLERLSFKVANFIAVPTIGNIKFIKQHNPNLKLPSIGILNMYQTPIKLKKTAVSFREKYHLEDKFIVIYGGSVGIAQKVDHLLNLAESTLEYNDIRYVIIGKGEMINKIKEDAIGRNITNIIFMDFMPQDEYLNLLSECNVGMIILNEKLASPNFPSKTVSYFNLGIPILASIDYVTDYGEFLDNERVGLWSYSGNLLALKANLLTLYKNKKLCSKFSENEQRYYYKHMRPEIACQTIIQQITLLKEKHD